jgi:hypothetical protein
MAYLHTLGSATWALSVAVQVCVLGLLLYRRTFLYLPVFTAYIVSTILESAGLFVMYRYSRWGPTSAIAAWAVQGVVTLIRVAAVMELCHHVFLRYPGIRVLISRALVICALLVGTLSLLFSARALHLKILYADRAVGLALAVAIVLLFVFARYYRVRPREPLQSMSIGFFLYSCFIVVNDSILEVFAGSYDALWNFLSVLSFVGSLLIWCRVLRLAYEDWETPPVLLPAGVYESVSPEVNVRLKMLDDRLSGLLKRADK